jgi:hypothetical protein
MKKKNYISNIDSVSALLDRLITEKIKQYFFFIRKKNKEAIKQSLIIKKITSKLNETLKEIYVSKKYNFIDEIRTFDNNSDISKLINNIENLIIMNLNIGIADNKLNRIIRNIKLSRNSLEGRAKNKNNIDILLKKLN